jgi:hypothetical protein
VLLSQGERGGGEPPGAIFFDRCYGGVTARRRISSALETEIDRLVNGLYGLAEEEMKMVEGS